MSRIYILNMWTLLKCLNGTSIFLSYENKWLHWISIFFLKVVMKASKIFSTIIFWCIYSYFKIKKKKEQTKEEKPYGTTATGPTHYGGCLRRVERSHRFGETPTLRTGSGSRCTPTGWPNNIRSFSIFKSFFIYLFQFSFGFVFWHNTSR